MKINVTKATLPPYDEYCEQIKKIWESHWLTNNGSIHNELAQKISNYLGVKNTVLYVNGHLALEAAIALFNFPKGSEIITTPFTFISTVNAIVRNGLVPRFCDIKSNNFTIDSSKIDELVNEKTVAILPVHVYGNVCDVDEIDKIAKKHGLKVIYDAAHAFGVKFKGRGIGSFGDLSMFSFHATKVFNTIEGGAVCFSDDGYTQTLNDMKNFGIRNEEESLYIGGNAKMNEFQASMGICNLRHINDNIKKRKKVFEKYMSCLGGIDGIILPSLQNDVENNYAYFPVIFDGYKFSRDEIKQRLATFDIGTRKYFYPIVSEFECYKYFDKGNTPLAKHVSERVLTLPLYPDLDLDDVVFISNIIKGK